MMLLTMQILWRPVEGSFAYLIVYTSNETTYSQLGYGASLEMSKSSLAVIHGLEITFSLISDHARTREYPS
jgi:hypothetical protein